MTKKEFLEGIGVGKVINGGYLDKTFEGDVRESVLYNCLCKDESDRVGYKYIYGRIVLNFPTMKASGLDPKETLLLELGQVKKEMYEVALGEFGGSLEGVKEVSVSNKQLAEESFLLGCLGEALNGAL